MNAASTSIAGTHPAYLGFLANYSEILNSPEAKFLLNITRYYNNSRFIIPLQVEHEIFHAACVSMDPQDPELMLSHKVYLFASLIFVMIGLVGNALSIMVFTSKVMRTVSSNVYLLFLAVSDSLYLTSVFSTKILTTLKCLYFIEGTFDIANHNSVLCKLFQYMLDLFSDYSTILILAFTIERYIACYHPINFKEICTLKRARTACAASFITISILIAAYHFLFIGRPTGYSTCAVLPENEAVFTILYVTEAVLFRVLPIFIIAALNIFIIIKVTKVSQDKQRRTSTRSGHSCMRRKSTREDKHRQLTIMLILVSSSYIIAYLPVLVHFVMWKLRRSAICILSERAMDMIQNYTKAMYIFGFAINFFLYTMSGRVFRDQLILMLFGKKTLRCNAVERTTENTGFHQHLEHQQQPLTVKNGKNGEEVREVEEQKNTEAITLV